MDGLPPYQGTPTEYTALTELYPILNQKGAIYADVGQYQSENLGVQLPTGTYPFMVVNPNYLKVFPVADSLGNSLIIEESETDWVILVPEQYQSQENSISQYFQSLRIGGRDEYFFGIDTEERFYNQPVKIIWTQENLEVFSANFNVYPENFNNIPDPLIAVMTLSNSVASDRRNAFTGGIFGPLQIHLINRSPIETYNDLLPSLESLHLEDNYSGIEVYGDSVAFEIQTLDYSAYENLAKIVMVSISFIVLAFISVVMFFSYQSRASIARKLRGHGLFRRYRSYFLLLLVNWSLMIWLFASKFYKNIFSSHDNSLDAGIYSWISLTPVVTYFLVEVGIVVLGFFWTERRNTVNLLKEE
jgi:hypothetical protein